jgi:phosphoheptose isomerase
VIAAVAGRRHITALLPALEGLEEDIGILERWGGRLASLFADGGRLLVAGNGGSAAEAQHLTAELVGRFETDRAPFSAIALHAETSSYTAIANDFGAAQAFARQVRAHGRPGDVLLALSTSGRSENVLGAADAAFEHGLVTWAMTGPAPNPLERLCDEALAVDSDRSATVQEAHLVAIHLLCGFVESATASAA